MTKQLSATSLNQTQASTNVSDYVTVVEDDGVSQTVIALANVENIVLSVSQPNLTISVNNDKIYFTGSYTAGGSATISYFNPPDGNELTELPTVVSRFEDVPPRKYVYRIDQPAPDGVTVNHTFTVNYEAGGNGTFSITRYVYPDINGAYNFLRNYEFYEG